MTTAPFKYPGLTFISNTPPYCEACISFAICNAILKNHIYPKTALREIAETKCDPMHDYLTYTFYDKQKGFERDISYRRICEVLDNWGIRTEQTSTYIRKDKWTNT